jgi:ADP-ribosylglycohydrolase
MPEPSAATLRAALARVRAGEGSGDFMSQQGWVLIAFQNAFRDLAIGTSIEEALSETVGAGGDADTNGAICGAFLGAAHIAVGNPLAWATVLESLAGDDAEWQRLRAGVSLPPTIRQASDQHMALFQHHQDAATPMVIDPRIAVA